MTTNQMHREQLWDEDFKKSVVYDYASYDPSFEKFRDFKKSYVYDTFYDPSFEKFRKGKPVIYESQDKIEDVDEEGLKKIRQGILKRYHESTSCRLSARGPPDPKEKTVWKKMECGCPYYEVVNYDSDDEEIARRKSGNYHDPGSCWKTNL